MDKSPEAFRTISEVAEYLDLPQHVLRFWETRFTQIRPMKRGGGRRYYRPDDVDLLRGIRHLLYGQGFTIRGVQKILREQGVRHVMTIWHEDGAEIAAAGEAEAVIPAAPMPPRVERAGEPHLPFEGAPRRAAAPEAVADLTWPVEPAAAETEPEGHPAPPEVQPAAKPAAPAPAAHHHPLAARAVPHPPAPAEEAPALVASPQERPVPGYGEHRVESHEKPVVARSVAEVAAGNAQRVGLIDRLRGHNRAADSHGGLSRDDVRRLQATLFELLECKRLLDQSR
ncbi:MAG TPA: MerR family transcriptional regulator [Kaistiaceae bacterium]|nr:MerR family transcriptional regulator [Kaistiaceae bacterium]